MPLDLPLGRTLCGLYFMKPVPPCNIAAVHQNSLVVSMVPKTLEKHPPTEERDLEGLYVNPNAVFMPSICTNAVRDQSSKKTVEVEEEEERPKCKVSNKRYEYNAIVPRRTLDIQDAAD